MSKIHHNPSTLSNDDWAELNMIDSMLTDIMLAGERQSSPKNTANVNIVSQTAYDCSYLFLLEAKGQYGGKKTL